LDCPDIAGAWFTVSPPDPHGFDDDANGYGCEGNAADGTTQLSGTQGIVTTSEEPVVDGVAQSCDPAYTSHCVPPVWEVGDLNCPYFTDQGIYGIVLADPANDPHGLDEVSDVGDGYGCAGEYEGTTTELSGTQGIVAPADAGIAPVDDEPVSVAPVPVAGECDPSYPDLCLPPAPPYLNCDYIYGLGASHITVYAPDPHGFDSDSDGVGCEG
jgi:hypothetical protein